MRYAFTLTTDKEDAKDLVQETFLKALKHCDKFVFDSNLKAWTYTIMKNTFVNNYRRYVNHKIYSDLAKENVSMDYTCTSDSFYPDSAYASKELEKSIEALHDDYKLPFKMHHEGFKYREIAEKLNMRFGTVKSRIFDARKKLMNQVNR